MTNATEPFVERTFTVDGHKVVCRFFQPEPDGLAFRCQFEIHWPEGVRTKSTTGGDGVQALLLAMTIAHVDLLSARENSGRIVLMDEQPGLDLPYHSAVEHWVREGPLSGPKWPVTEPRQPD